jgi:hypothetical protein
MSASHEDGPLLTLLEAEGAAADVGGFAVSAGVAAGEMDEASANTINLRLGYPDTGELLLGAELDPLPDAVNDALDEIAARRQPAHVELLPTEDSGAGIVTTFSGVFGKPGEWWVHVLNYGDPSMPFYGVIKRQSDSGTYSITGMKSNSIQYAPGETQKKLIETMLNELASAHLNEQQEVAQEAPRRVRSMASGLLSLLRLK